MSGFKNDTVVAKNADFSQAAGPNATSSESNGLNTNGQMWIGSTATNAGGTHINVGALTSPDSSITFSYSSPNITATVTGGTSVLKTLTGDSGGAISPTAGNINTLGSGSITTVGSGSTITTQLTGLTNHALLIGAGTSTITKLASGTTGQVLQTNTSADPTWSTATYPSTATSTGTILRATGTNWAATTSTYPNTNAVNTILYASSANVMSALATANSAILNTSAGGVPSLATSPSVSGTITAGTGFTATTGNVTITSGNLTLAATSSSSIGSILSGGTRFMHAFGSSNTFLGSAAGNYTLSGGANTGIGAAVLGAVTSGAQNTGLGSGALSGMQTGGNNTAIGQAAMQNATAGDSNTAIGLACMASNSGYTQCTGVGQQALQAVTGNNNVGIGYAAGVSIGAGAQNTAIGTSSLNQVTTGSGNIALGYTAGTNYSTSDSNNICIGNSGTGGVSAEIQIGTNGTHTKCTIQGISGVTVTGSAVLCSTAGLLGTIVSSERYKENIELMSDDISVLHLEPIKFNYIGNEAIQYGLLAEKVHEDFPYLCLYNKENQPESVKYHEICVFLLHEIKKLDKRIKELEAR